jgi:hypothetical protein
MALRADFELDVPDGRTGNEAVPADAGDLRRDILWMKILFHYYTTVKWLL